MVDLILLRQEDKERYFLLKHNSILIFPDNTISIHEDSIIEEKGDYLDYYWSYKDYREYSKTFKEIILEKRTKEETKLFLECI